MREDIKCKGDRINTIRVELDYDLGGYQYSTGREKPRGYYISVQPLELVHHDNGLVSYRYSAFTGYYKLLYPCQRRSKSSEAKAMEQYQANKRMLVNKVVEEMNLTLEEDVLQESK